MRILNVCLAAALVAPWPARLLAQDCRDQADSCAETCSIDHGMERSRDGMRACLKRCSDEGARCRAKRSGRPLPKPSAAGEPQRLQSEGEAWPGRGR